MLTSNLLTVPLLKSLVNILARPWVPPCFHGPPRGGGGIPTQSLRPYNAPIDDGTPSVKERKVVHDAPPPVAPGPVAAGLSPRPFVVAPGVESFPCETWWLVLPAQRAFVVADYIVAEKKCYSNT